MIKPYTYILVNFFTVIICLVASFDKRIGFHRQFGNYLKAAIIVAVPFIAWDVWFTRKGIWWFDTSYTLGWSMAGLPVEEWLFFFCIPFSCIFTYYCLDRFFDLRRFDRFSGYVARATIAVCLAVLIVFYDRMYTVVTALATIITMIYLYWVARVKWIGRGSFVFLVLMAGFFPVNGILTGTGIDHPIVNYNTEEILNLRMLTIPVEDAVYGYTQFLLVLYFFKLFQKSKL